MADDRRLQFDRAAPEYDRTRPGYPAVLVAELDPPGVTLEVGCGSGQLTKDLVERGHQVTAVDPGANLVAIARPRLADVTFVVAPFEDVDLPKRSFDLVVSATAFHWIDPDIAYVKAWRLLRDHGRIALLSHRVVAGPLAADLDDVLRRCAPTFPLGAGFTAADLAARLGGADPLDISSLLAAIEGNPTRAVSADRWFTPPQVRTVEWDENLTPDELLTSLRATSIWPAIPEHERDALSDGICQFATDIGGSIPRRRVTTLLLARRRYDRTA